VKSFAVATVKVGRHDHLFTVATAKDFTNTQTSPAWPLRSTQ